MDISIGSNASLRVKSPASLLKAGWFRFLFIGLVAVTLVLAAGCGDGGINFSTSDEPVETHEDTFSVGTSPRLVVLSFNGGITVEASTDGSITVKATVRRADKVDYRVTQDRDTITVVADQRERTTGRSPGAEILVAVPTDTEVKLVTSNGAIQVRGVERSGTIETSNGAIDLENVKGDFVADTSNGTITVGGVVGSVNLETTNGRIDFTGELTPGGRNVMRTSNGSIDIMLRGTPSVKVDATTSNGTIRSDVPIRTSSTRSTRLEGTIGSGEAGLTVRTSNGSIVIR